MLDPTMGSGTTLVAGAKEGYIIASASDPDGDSISEYRFRFDGGSWSTTSSNQKDWYKPDNDPHTVDVQVVDSNGAASDVKSCTFRVSYTPQVVEYSGPNDTNSDYVKSFDAWIVDPDFDYPEVVYIEIYDENTGNCLTNNGPLIPCGESAERVSGWDSQDRVRYWYRTSSWSQGSYSYRFTVQDSYGKLSTTTPKKYFTVP